MGVGRESEGNLPLLSLLLSSASPFPLPPPPLSILRPFPERLEQASGYLFSTGV